MRGYWRGLLPVGRFTGLAVVLCLVFVCHPHETSAQPTDQYKRRSQDTFTQIVKGNLDAAQELLDAYQIDYPGDLEALFVESVMHAAAGRPEQALASAKKAVTGGLPAGRFIVGPRSQFEILADYEPWSTWIDSLDVPLIHGPMIGDLRPTSIRIWVRTDTEREVVVEAAKMGARRGTVLSEPVWTRAAGDYTAKLALAGLEPDTRYEYHLEIDGKRHPGAWVFDTPGLEGSPSVLKVAFGGGAGYTPWYETMWDVVASRDPMAFLFLGDNVYIDNPELTEVQLYTYYRRQSVPRYRQFVSSTGIFAIWDDHDFTTDDGWGGPEIEEPSWKRNVWNVYRQNWVNPSFGGGEEQPGVWYRFALGDVDFFMLDGRYYREDPGNEAPRSMLGQVQKEWLLKELAASVATFKVIASPVPWAENTKPGSLDTWDGYAEEREDIFDFVAGREIEGVVLISADRHRSDLWRIPRGEGYDLFEFESSRLTNVHFHDVMEGAEFGYNQKPSFGMLTFDTTREDPQVTYEIVSIDNETIYSFRLPLSRLSVPVRQ